jgi:hypothetical protein
VPIDRLGLCRIAALQERGSRLRFAEVRLDKEGPDEKRVPHVAAPLLLRCSSTTALSSSAAMIHFKTLSLLAVLLALVPVTPVEKVPMPDDPESLPADQPELDFPEDDVPEGDGPTAGRPTAGAAPISNWRDCALRCYARCVGKRNENRCATRFIARRCESFGTKVDKTVLNKCLGAMACENNGMKVCHNNFECLLEEQCCLEGECPTDYRCVNHWCAAKGRPSFTLTWSGAGAYDDNA